MRSFFIACYLIFGIFQVYACDSKSVVSHSREAVVLIDDLIFEQDVILANVNGILRSVRSLENRKGLWIAQFDFGKEDGYCPRGHDLCHFCHLCHKKDCYYYVEPCWRR
jgi:hypothetical protein